MAEQKPKGVDCRGEVVVRGFARFAGFDAVAHAVALQIMQFGECEKNVAALVPYGAIMKIFESGFRVLAKLGFQIVAMQNQLSFTAAMLAREHASVDLGIALPLAGFVGANGMDAARQQDQ